MQKVTKQNFFTRNGKRLRKYINETINVMALPTEKIPTISIAEQPKRNVKEKLLLKVNSATKIITTVKNIKPASVKKTWIAGSYAFFALIAVVTVLYPMKIAQKMSNKYSIYSSKPLILGSAEYQVYSRDARAQKINMIFREYKCPLEGLGEVFVYEADKNNIPWWLVAAISFQESSCGKKTPEPDGFESYNAWGWGVYGENVQGFDNWVRGVETVSHYLNERFFSKGIVEPCDIMKVYTPPSKGSWCEGVKHFGGQIQNYSTPTDDLES